jgi:hypothetical protein
MNPWLLPVSRGTCAALPVPVTYPKCYPKPSTSYPQSLCTAPRVRNTSDKLLLETLNYI